MLRNRRSYEETLPEPMWLRLMRGLWPLALGAAVGGTYGAVVTADPKITAICLISVFITFVSTYYLFFWRRTQ